MSQGETVGGADSVTMGVENVTASSAETGEAGGADDVRAEYVPPAPAAPVMIRVTSLEQLEVIETDIEIHRPVDGAILLVPIRGVTQTRLIELKRTISWPLPPDKMLPVKGGKPQIVKDENDPAYREALEKAAMTYNHLLLLECVRIDFGGETPEERLRNCERRLGSWALAALTDALGRIHNISTGEMEDAAKN